MAAIISFLLTSIERLANRGRPSMSIAFNDAAERIGRLGKGDSLAVTGSLKPTNWQDKQTGEERHGLNITVSACLSPYDVRKRRSVGEVPDDPKPRSQAAARREPVYAEDEGFDDDLSF